MRKAGRMPEGDTVFQAAGRLQAALAGKPLTRCDIRVPRYVTVDLTGRTVDEALARGKHLLIRVGASTIHSHLKMEGIWFVGSKTARWPRPTHQARIILETESSVAVGFALGRLEVIRRADESSVVGYLGPDLLGPDWDADRAEANLRRRPERPIGHALLDQTNLAGIGNVYRCELCFLHRTHPATPVGDIADLSAWMASAHRLLLANRDRPVRVTTGVDRPGRGLWVYGRDRRACLRCGTTIRAGRLGGSDEHDRSVYWCPACQPEPGPGSQ